MQNDNQKIPINVIVASILLALFADTKILNFIVLAALPSLAGTFMALMYAVVVVGLFVVGFLWQKSSLLNFSPSHVTICILCILWYFITSTFIGEPSVSVPFFCIFTISAFIIPGIVKIDVRTFLLALLMLPSVGVFYIDTIIFNAILEEGTLSMGKCYAMLVPVIANVVYLRFYYLKETNFLKIIQLPFCAINIYYMVQMAMFGSRGPMLCVLLLIAFCTLIKIDEFNQISIRKNRTLIYVAIVLFIAISFKTVLQTISDFLATFDISLNVIDKFLKKDDIAGDMSNGRDAIDIIAWSAIEQRPLLGHGTAQFENNTGIVYPHNFIVQMLYDGGFFLAICVFVPILRAFISKIRNTNLDYTILLTLLFFASVPGAYFSGDLWQGVVLWMFFGFVLSKQFELEKYNY